MIYNIFNIFNLKYPQSIWSDSTYNLLSKNKILYKIDYIYDAPCGAGWITYSISKKTKKKFILVDIDPLKIKFAEKIIDYEEVVYKKSSLMDLKFRKKSLWMLINSLYLLDKNAVYSLIHREKKNIDYIIGVFPYTNTINYDFYTKNIDKNLNINTMSREETEFFFEKSGYSLIDSCDTTFFNFHIYSKGTIIKIISNIIFSILEKVYSFKGNNYWIAIFERR